jgi:two-component system invasion response regulator UvrY
MDTVFIVDDYPLFRQGYAALLDESPDLSVCGTAASFDEALQAIPQAHPDLVLVDLSLGEDDEGGLALIGHFGNTVPEDIRWLVVSGHEAPERVQRALDAGAHGFLSKRRAADELRPAIRSVLGGEPYVALWQG